MITLEALGLSKDEIADRVVEKLAHDLLNMKIGEPDDGDYSATPFAKEMKARVTAKIHESIEAIAAAHVLPNVQSYLEGFCLQETNAWGEKTAKPVTFTEYLVKRAEAYMQEKVDYNGKTKAEAGGYSWDGKQTRINYLINSHLHYRIEAAMKEVIGAGNKTLVEALAKTCEAQLQSIAANLKVAVSTK
jgi:hypothetical protein